MKKTQQELCAKLLKEIQDNYALLPAELEVVKRRIDAKEYEGLIDEYMLEGVRVCSDCGKLMDEGYCISGGCEYYCGDTCLRKHYKGKARRDLGIGEDGSDSYWTAWEV